MAPGSSLGGARPKATVRAVDGSLWVAKFPSKHDESNTGAWEKVVHDLARLCALDVPESKLETFSKSGGTFLAKRFDRDGKRRIHFASAMTLRNPVPFGDRLSLNITELDNSIDPALAIEVAEYFGLSKPEAEKILDEIVRAVQKNWIEIAERTGLSRDAVEYMRPAFSLRT
jgi:hypothetical protein